MVRLSCWVYDNYLSRPTWLVPLVDTTSTNLVPQRTASIWPDSDGFPCNTCGGAVQWQRSATAIAHELGWAAGRQRGEYSYEQFAALPLFT